MLFEKALYPVMIIKILEEYSDKNHPLSVSKIQNHMNELYDFTPCRNTIVKYIERLKSIGFEIETIQKHCNWYYLSKRILSSGEIKLLCDVIHASFFISSKDSQNIINKLLAVLSKNDRNDYIDHVHKENRKKDLYSSDFFEKYAILSEACDRHIPLEVTYCKTVRLNGSELIPVPKKYLLFPFALIANDGRAYLIGQVKGKTKPAHYRVDRFKSIKQSTELFPKDLLFDCSDYYEKYDCLYMHSGEKINARFLGEKKILNAIYDRVGRSARIYENPKNPNEFYLSVYASEFSVLLLAQQYMDGLTLLDPPEARNKFINICNAALTRTCSIAF